MCFNTLFLLEHIIRVEAIYMNLLKFEVII